MMNRNRLPRVTGHCATRYVERAGKAADHNMACFEVKRIMATGRRYGWGRGRWADYLELRPGCILIEDVLDPGTAVIVGHGVALTTVTEAMYLDSNEEDVNGE